MKTILFIYLTLSTQLFAESLFCVEAVSKGMRLQTLTDNAFDARNISHQVRSNIYTLMTPLQIKALNEAQVPVKELDCDEILQQYQIIESILGRSEDHLRFDRVM